MIVLTINNQKGGVGKTFVGVNFATYARRRYGLRVLFIDTDQQANASDFLRRAKIEEGNVRAEHLFLQRGLVLDVGSDFFLIPTLQKKENEEVYEKLNIIQIGTYRDELEERKKNFRACLTDSADYFDLCVIDTNPNNDYRVACALEASDFALTVVEAENSSFKGVKTFVDEIAKAKQKNNGLFFLGILPNKYEKNTVLHNTTISMLEANYDEYLFTVKDEEGNNVTAKMPKRNSTQRAQAKGLPVWEEVAKQATADKRDVSIFELAAEKDSGWLVLQQVFDQMLNKMNLVKG